MEPTTIIQTDGLMKVYGIEDAEVFALAGVDVQIKESEFVAIMGPSGSGKSTLMNILGCLDRPTSGKYSLAGVEVSGMNKTELAEIRNERLGFIFQSYNLLPGVTALENVMLPMQYNRKKNISYAEQKERALAGLQAVGLEKRVNHVPNELSGGQKQRVAIARALINDPVLILADEPTGNLDSRSSDDVIAMLVDLHKRGRTIVMVTHNEEVAAYAERVIRFRDGKVERDERNANPLVPKKTFLKEETHEPL